MHRPILIFVVVLALALTSVPSAQRSAAPQAPPRLLVIVVVDQMRADYVTRFRSDWTSGLKRLLSEGAYFSSAAYPYLTTVTCAGHATIATGAFPRLHGVFQNVWYDRRTRQLAACADDADAGAIGYGPKAQGGSSARSLLMPTLADELRARRPAQVVTLSLKARSAVMLAGHGGEAVTWLSLNGWETSSAYARRPVPAVKAFIDANPIDRDYGKIWTPLLPSSRYQGPDDAVGEAPPEGWTRTFPHALTGGGRGGAQFRAQWQESPFADAYLGRMAAALVETMKLGSDDVTDVLGISFSSPDNVGHAFGPASHEVQDVFARLDQTLGRLLGRLDALVGRDRYVVAFTADHGVGEVTEQRQQAGRDGGRLSSIHLADVAERAARGVLGPGEYVAVVNENDLYFEPGVYEKLGAAPDGLSTVVNALEKEAGVLRVFRQEQLAGRYEASDRSLRAAALSYVPGRSGDLVLAPRPGWVVSSSATAADHGTANRYDQEVPLMLMGRGVRHGEYTEEATPADIAPTLAALAGVTLPRAEGRVLWSALTVAPPLPPNR